MKKVILLLLIALMTGCVAQKKRTAFTADNLKISLKKTPCRGKCPVYNLEITGDGKAVFIGKKNVEKIGTFELMLTPVQVANLVKAFEKANFWELEDEYTAWVTDLPTTFISLTLDGKSKKIKDYYKAPQELKQLENKVVAIKELPGWIKIENE